MASQHLVITHPVKDWPVLVLHSCPLLIREAKAAAGLSWKGLLHVWDECLRNWVCDLAGSSCELSLSDKLVCLYHSNIIRSVRLALRYHIDMYERRVTS